MRSHLLSILGIAAITVLSLGPRDAHGQANPNCGDHRGADSTKPIAASKPAVSQPASSRAVIWRALNCSAQPAAEIAHLWESPAFAERALPELLVASNRVGTEQLTNTLLKIASRTDQSDSMRLYAFAALASQIDWTAEFSNAATFLEHARLGFRMETSGHARGPGRDVPWTVESLQQLARELDRMAKNETAPDLQLAARFASRYAAVEADVLRLERRPREE